MPGVGSVLLWLLSNGFTALVLVVVFLVGRWWESDVARRRELEVKLAESRQTLYRKFMHDIWAKAMDGTMKEADITGVMKPWSYDMFLVASDDVVKKYLAFLANSNLNTGADLLKAMRRDMGNVNTTLSLKQVLQSFIKPSDWPQIDDLLAARSLPGQASATVATAGVDAPHD